MDENTPLDRSPNQPPSKKPRLAPYDNVLGDITVNNSHPVVKPTTIKLRNSTSTRPIDPEGSSCDVELLDETGGREGGLKGGTGEGNDDNCLLNRLSEIRSIESLEAMRTLYTQLIPLDRRLPETFWASYESKYILLGLKAVVLVHIVSSGRIVPREFQLEATLALLKGNDSLVDVGTGYGKTLCLILPALLFPNEIALVISPFKRLQAVQLLEFAKFHISAVSINEDTPQDDALWTDIEKLRFTILLVQPEQLDTLNGHSPRLLRLITKKKSFTALIKRVHIDEAHFIFTAGLPHYGLPAFRPAWGKLDRLRIQLPSGIPFQALSGTQPEHIKKAIISGLLFKERRLSSIKLSCNRPNITYAVHELDKSLTNFHNLDFLIPKEYPADFSLRKTIVFHDNINILQAATAHINGLLPMNLQNTGIVREYHSAMSLEYLTAVFEDFANPKGRCRILNATEGASTGLDIADITAVVQYGIPRDLPTCLQRGGRCGRDGRTESIFAILYEPWVKDADISTAGTGTDNSAEIESLDPDQPHVGKLSERSSKHERTGVGIINIIQKSSNECLRALFASANGDDSPDVLRFTGRFCCNSTIHSLAGSENFTYTHFFPNLLSSVDDTKNEELDDTDKEKKRQVKHYRPVEQRSSLSSRLAQWRHDVFACDPCGGVRPISFILSNDDIQTITKTYPDDIVGPESIGRMLDKSNEWTMKWADSILHCVRSFDMEQASLITTAATQRKEEKKAAKIVEAEQSFEKNKQDFEDEFAQKTQAMAVEMAKIAQEGFEGGQILLEYRKRNKIKL